MKDFAGKIYSKETFAYNREGHVISQSIWQNPEQIATTHMTYDSNGDLLAKKDALGYQTTWIYDYQNTRNQLGQTVKKCIKQDALGRLNEDLYDAFGRLAMKKVYTDNQESACTHYTYNAKGQLIKEISSVRVDGQPIRDYGVIKTYDVCGRLVTETEYPQGKTLQFIYDQKGRLSQKIKPDGVSLFYRYDDVGRLCQLTSSDGTLNYEYAYDANDNPIQVKDHIHGIHQKRTYDCLNRITDEEIQQGISIHYQYDAIGRMTCLTLPDGSWIRYLYNTYYLTHIQRFNPFGQLLYQCECQDYTMDGRVLTTASPAGLIHYNYDLLGRVTSIQAKQWQVQLDAFDAVGNLLARTPHDPINNNQEVFSYNRFDHLVSESAPENTYQYDSLGNCLAKNQQTRVINAFNQVLDDGNCQYTYDANGNLLTQSQPWRNYRYDAYNRLINCQTETDNFSFIYDVWGRCLKIKNSQGIRHLLYQGNHEIGSVLNNQIDELKVIHPTKNKELVFALELQNKVYFPIQDERYNICALQNPNGSLAQWIRYSAFGKIQQEGEVLLNPWTFANRREVANLSLFLHRFYNPQLMRWQTTDPLGYVDGLNLYAYVHNNPFLYNDPDGQYSFGISLFSSMVLATFTVTFEAVATAAAASASAVALPVIAVAAVAYVGYNYGNDIVGFCRDTGNNCYNGIVGNHVVNNQGQEIESVKDQEIEPTKSAQQVKKPPRTQPKDLKEQLTLEEAKAGAGKEIMEDEVIHDKKYPKDEWAKMQHNHKPLNAQSKADNVSIHYWEHRETQERNGFKFKNE